VKIANIQGCDLRAAKSHLQPNGKNGAVAQTNERVGRRRVENFPRLYFREGGCAALDAIDRRPLHIDDRVTRGDPMPDKMFEQTRQRREATAHG
jgi:hypothetical protein